MLFKYLPSERVDVLEKLKIRFSPIVSLNDPFECQPLIDIEEVINSISNEQIIDLDKLWVNTNQNEKTEDNKKIYEKERLKVVDMYKNKYNPYLFGQTVVEDIKDLIGILSLSRAGENLLMWSHYAEEGKGIVLGFDDDHEFFKQPGLDGKSTRPSSIVYTTKRSKITYSDISLYEKMLCEKPFNWAYEEEERLFRYFKNREGNTEKKDNYGMDIVLSDLPKEVIKSVYLGYQISYVTKYEALSEIEFNKIPCKVYQARISETEYKIEFDLIADKSEFPEISKLLQELECSFW
jgi:hypothetical protein